MGACHAPKQDPEKIDPAKPEAPTPVRPILVCAEHSGFSRSIIRREADEWPRSPEVEKGEQSPASEVSTREPMSQDSSPAAVTTSGTATLPRLDSSLDDVEEEEALTLSLEHSACFQSLGPLTSSTIRVRHAGPCFTTVAECVEPVLFEIAGYLVASPRDMACFSALTSTMFGAQMELMQASLWEALYARKWPAFHECLRHTGPQCWRTAYQDTFDGVRECVLEVFDREKRRGFAMSAMPARLTYCTKFNTYRARYISASDVPPETISLAEEHRLRFCPASAREALQAGLSSTREEEALQTTGSIAPCYPYKVLEGLQDLEVGKGVEFQWKMQYGSPFGWWYGNLESLIRHADGTADATITFAHFPADSRWHRLEVRVGDAEIRVCSFGGFTGGLRRVTQAEHQHWMKFFPKEPVTF